MLTLTLDDVELFDSSAQEFYTVTGGTFNFEHSLNSIAKWEGIWKQPYLNQKELSDKKALSYFQCMCVDNVMPSHELFDYQSIEVLHNYINDDQTATKIQNEDKTPSRRIVTAEVIYANMVAGNIPFECAGWHFSRLLTLLQVVAIQQQPEKKMSQEEILRQNRELNEERKRKYKTKG